MHEITLRWLIKHFISEIIPLSWVIIFKQLCILLEGTCINYYYLLFLLFHNILKDQVKKKKKHVKAITPCFFWWKSIFSLLLTAVKINTTASVHSLECQLSSWCIVTSRDIQQPIIIAGWISTKCHVCIWRFAKQHHESEAPVSSILELVLKRTTEGGGKIRRRACCDWEKNGIDPSGKSHSHSWNWTASTCSWTQTAITLKGFSKRLPQLAMTKSP